MNVPDCATVVREYVTLCCSAFVVGLVFSVPESNENVQSFAVQHAVLGLVVSVPESTENVQSFVVQHAVLGLVGHEFSFAECDDYEKR